MKNIKNVEFIKYSDKNHYKKYWYFGKSLSEVMLSPNGMNVKHITHNCALITYN